MYLPPPRRLYGVRPTKRGPATNVIVLDEVADAAEAPRQLGQSAIVRELGRVDWLGSAAGQSSRDFSRRYYKPDDVALQSQINSVSFGRAIQ